MQLTPLTREQAEQIEAYLKPLENKYSFLSPDTMETQMITTVTIAPYDGLAQAEFKFSLQTGVHLNDLIERFNGPGYTVLVIANTVSLGNITLAQPYFYDFRDLERRVKGFAYPSKFS